MRLLALINKNMKLTKAQQNDLESIRYFIPQVMEGIKITDLDIEMFFEHSEKGLHKEKVSKFPYLMDGFNALIQGKSWRGVHVGMYEEGVMDGSMPYCVIFGDDYIIIHRKWWQFWKARYTRKHVCCPPRSVVDFMKKEMFKGIDAEMIDEGYEERFNPLCNSGIIH